MENKEPKLTMSQQYNIAPLEEEPAAPIAKSDWKRLKKRVENIRPSISFFNNMGYTLIGIAATALLSALLIPKGEQQSTNAICWAIFGGALFSGLLCIGFAHIQRKDVLATRDDAIDEMTDIEKKHRDLQD